MWYSPGGTTAPQVAVVGAGADWTVEPEAEAHDAADVEEGLNKEVEAPLTVGSEAARSPIANAVDRPAELELTAGGGAVAGGVASPAASADEEAGAAEV